MVRLLVAAAAALVLTACAPATLDVLDPAPGKDSDAGVPDATVDGAQDSGAGDVSPSGDVSTEEPAEAIGCLGDLSPCTFAGQCCSLACVPSTGDDTQRRQCSDTPTCAVAGAACTVGADCCEDVCMAVHCGSMPPPMCKPAGEACAGNPECCGQVCSGGHCALLEGCRVQGEICGSSTDCCTAVCQIDAQSVGHCTPLPMCNENDHKGCTQQVGDICGGNPDCCSRECSMLADGVKRCVPAGGCRSQCELCSSNADCCSGVCNGPDGSMGVCQPAPTCGADGEMCGGNPDCCAGETCVKLPPPSMANRCEVPVDGACRSEGSTCAVPSECCSALCLASSTGLSCASMCVADGNACTSDGDCCTTGSACMVVDGVLTCEPVLL